MKISRQPPATDTETETETETDTVRTVEQSTGVRSAEAPDATADTPADAAADTGSNAPADDSASEATLVTGPETEAATTRRRRKKKARPAPETETETETETDVAAGAATTDSVVWVPQARSTGPGVGGPSSEDPVFVMAPAAATGVVAPRARWRALRQRLLVPTLAVLVVLGSALSLVLALSRPTTSDGTVALPSDSDGRYLPADLSSTIGPALVAATSTVPLALAYDYQQMPYLIRVAVGGMTDSFAQRYKADIYARVAPLARTTRGRANAEVEAAGVISTPTADEVRCLLYVDQEVTSARPARGTAAHTTNRFSVLADVVRVDGRWLVDNLAPVT